MNTFKVSLISASLLLAFGSTACTTVGSKYERPPLDLPASIGDGQAAINSTVPVDWLTWWKSFQDPVLNALLDEALANNQDLILAAGRIEEARANSALTYSNRYPTVDATGAASKTRSSENSGKLPAGASPASQVFQLGLNTSYEIDFWGKLNHADQAARARLLALEANSGLVQTTLYTSIAQSYFALRSYDAQVTLADSAFQTRQENLRLQQKRFSAGSVGTLELHQAESEVAATEITLAQARRSVANTESVLALLVGRSPSAIARPQIARGAAIATLYSHVVVPSDLPSDLLNRRPDIIAAEQSLIASNADVGQAKAQYFPTIKLTSSIGYESRVFQDLFNPASLLWNLGANLVQPVFRAGAIGAVVAGAEARKSQARAEYVHSVQNAFRDVHDALSNLSADDQIYRATQRRAAALKDTLRLANLRYNNGYSSYLEVLSAQRDLLQTESSLIDVQRSHLSALVGLYKAMGGGWEKSQSLASN
ncbi:MAG: efflux transporter outer membrane subunit [Pseudomonadota bacterium]